MRVNTFSPLSPIETQMPRDNTIEVILNEGRGYRLWKWNPNLTEHEFPLWWGDMRDSEFIKFYFNIRSLPGKVVPYKAMTNGHSDAQRMPGDPLHFRPYYYCHFHEMHDSFIAVGETQLRYRQASRRDWRENWRDWVMKQELERMA